MNMTMTATEFKKQLPRILPTELVVFLKKEKVFRAYTNNIYAEIKTRSRDRIKLKFDNICNLPAEYILVSSFTWKNTPEKHIFWSDLNQKFSNYLEGLTTP